MESARHRPSEMARVSAGKDGAVRRRWIRRIRPRAAPAGASTPSAGAYEGDARSPQPTVSKHQRVLREAGFVESTVDAQRRLYRLKPEPLQAVDAWLAPFRRCWARHV